MKKTLLSSNRIVKAFTLEVKAVNEKDHIVEGIFSTAAIDRHGEVVVQEGWKLDDYIKNPVVLWSHDNYQFPLAQMTRIGFENGNLAGAMKFAVEEYDMAATAFALMKGKYLRAFSVGFMNNVYEIDNGSDVVKLIENVLLEVSVVNVPANQEALAKIKALDVLKDAEPQDGEPKGDETKPEDKKEDEPKATDEGEGATIAEDNALKALSSNEKTIRRAIKALTDALNALTEADNQVGKKVEHSAKPRAATKKVSVTTINRALRELMEVKRKQQ